MKTVCAWCEKEGRETIVRETDEKTPGISHGICPKHEDEMQEQMKRHRNSNPIKCLTEPGVDVCQEIIDVAFSLRRKKKKKRKRRK